MIIQAIEMYLPETIVTNADLASQHPEWDMPRVEERAGVLERHIAGQDETAFDLALKAARLLELQHPGVCQQSNVLLFCTQSEDYIMPSNSYLMHAALGMREDVMCFDINQACSGFVYGLGILQGLVGSDGMQSGILINADTYSKYIHPDDRSTRVLFGDGATATYVAAHGKGLKLRDVVYGSNGSQYSKFMIPAGGARQPKNDAALEDFVDRSGNVRNACTIQMDGLGILAFVNSKVPEQIRCLLTRNSLTIDDVDHVVLHQASKVAVDSICYALGVPESKRVLTIGKVGNTVSASIPMALKELMGSVQLTPGMKILISGFGVGLSWATALLEVVDE